MWCRGDANGHDPTEGEGCEGSPLIGITITVNYNCSSGNGNNNGNNNNNDNQDDGNDGGGGGGGNNNNDNDPPPGGGGDTNDAPDLPTEQVLGGGEDEAVESFFEPYFCPGVSMEISDINWIFANDANHAQAQDIYNYLFETYGENPGDDVCVEIDFQEKIVNNLTGKAKCIFDILQEQDAVKSALNRFRDEESPANLAFEMKSLGEVHGNTDPPTSNDLIVIQLNSDSGFWGVGFQPNLLVAQTIFHEMLHGEFFRQLIEAIGAGNYTEASVGDIFQALIDNEYYTLYEHIRNHKDWSHNFMANYYRETIARITQEYDTGITVPTNQQPDQLYLDLAWRGLRIDGEVQAWDNLSNEEQTRIDNAINMYTEQNSNQTCN